MLKKYKKDAYIDENMRMIEKNQQKNEIIPIKLIYTKIISIFSI